MKLTAINISDFQLKGSLLQNYYWTPFQQGIQDLFKKGNEIINRVLTLGGKDNHTNPLDNVF